MQIVSTRRNPHPSSELDYTTQVTGCDATQRSMTRTVAVHSDPIDSNMMLQSLLRISLVNIKLRLNFQNILAGKNSIQSLVKVLHDQI